MTIMHRIIFSSLEAFVMKQLHTILTAALIALFASSLASAVPASADAVAKQQQTIMVQLQHFTDNLHAASMALKLANGLQSKGAKVTLFLNLEAVRIADNRQPQDNWMESLNFQLRGLFAPQKSI